MKRAFVLHYRPYQEHSLIVTLFTKEEGKVQVLAKGAKKAKSKWAALLEPFYLLEVDWRGRGALPTLIQADGIRNLKSQGNFLFSGLYLNELVQRILPDHYIQPVLFENYQSALELLYDQVYIEPVLRRFEWQLAEQLGFAFDWQQDALSSKPIQAHNKYCFYPDKGFVEVEEEDPTMFVLTGAEIQALANFELTDQKKLHQYKYLMHLVLKPYLGNKPLYSRRLFINTERSL